ncbi:MAG TPA: hypothetical protein VJ764_00805, partial [Steroidobacteraceae bacterium]|nr:hypothetical protein [Steroidobacteraceae bacterium]
DDCDPSAGVFDASISALADEVRALREELDQTGDPLQYARRQENAELRAEVGRVNDQIRALRAELAEARRNVDLFREASEAAELRVVELRADLERASIDIEEALEARDKWHQLALEQKAAVERVESLLQDSEGEPFESIFTSSIRAAIRGDE